MEREKNLKLALMVCFFAALTGICATSKAEIIYVDDSAIGANDGTSWEDAYIYLQDALADANSAEKPVEIRVAQGIYTPDLGGGNTPYDWYATFQLINGVTIQGGYAGLDFWNPDARETSIFETILSGDLNGDDDPNLQNYTENSCHVVTGSFTDETAILDGFTITAGYRHSFDPNNDPSGGIHMLIESGSPTIVNCSFINNQVSVINSQASSLLNYNNSNPTITNCTFLSSRVENEESNSVLIDCIFQNCGMYNDESSSILTNCTFEGLEGNSNAAIKQSYGSLTLEGCSFIDNSGSFTGGIFNSSGDLTINDSVFIRNHSEMGSGGGGVKNLSGNLTLSNCIFSGNSANFSGGGIYSNGGSVKLINCDFINNSARYGGAIYFLHGLILHNCRFSGNHAGEAGAINAIFSDEFDIRNCIFEGNTSGSGSPIDIDPSFGTLYNCTFYGNWTSSSRRLSGLPNLTGCIVRNDAINQTNCNMNVTYSNVEGGYSGEGNIDVDPCFVNPGYWVDASDTDVVVEPNNPNAVWIMGDYHLKSQAGRWDSQSEAWVIDNIDSLCIDAGDPNSPIGFEPFPNGGVYNMGAYGRSIEASKTYFGAPVCDVILAGDINGDCVVDFEDLFIVVSQWMLSGEDFINSH